MATTFEIPDGRRFVVGDGLAGVCEVTELRDDLFLVQVWLLDGRAFEAGAVTRESAHDLANDGEGWDWVD